MLANADRLLTVLAAALAWVGAAAVVALMGITVVAVFFRYVMNDPIFGIEDLSIIALTVVAGASVAYGGRHGAHVSVDVISYSLGSKVTRITDAVMRLLALGILALATWALFTKACGMEKACITGNFSIEHRPFYYFLGVCLGLYTLQVLIELMVGIRAERPADRESPP
ncbi:MAG: TRAP transporter small permease [Pseudomonadota bacterium]